MARGLFDTHAHYTDKRFEREFEGGACAALEFAFSHGVGRIINVGTELQNSRESIELAKKFEGLYAAVGIHPTDVPKAPDLELALSELYGMISEREANKVVALGEIGLDYYWQNVAHEDQMRYFEAQLRLAEELDIPVIIHDREAHGDVFETVIKHKSIRGVFHSYSGSEEMARELCRRGWYISISGVVTFKNAPKVRAVAAAVPEDRILIETDAPYLAPVPHRGKLNFSYYALKTAEAVAEARGVSPEELVSLTYDNANRLFGLRG